jgi:hypothetical chaperone protein
MGSCGIDFGTSNSAISVNLPGGARLVPVETGDMTLPSAMFYPASHKAPLFGRAAIGAFFEGEDGRFLRSLKRLLGTSAMNFGTIINEKPRRFEDIIGRFVANLKAKAEEATGRPLDSVVMGRPVHFVDHDEGADFAAGEQLAGIARSAGFRNIAFQFEPIAAAFAHEQKISAETLALVIDIGGGTSDFTAIRLGTGREDRAADILGNYGIRAGGNDFDRLLSLAAFMPGLGYKTAHGGKGLDVPLGWFHDMSEWSKINFLYTPKVRAEVRDALKSSHAPEKLSRFSRLVETEKGHRLLSIIEGTKIALTGSAETGADLGFLEDNFTVTATRAQFEDAISGQMGRISAAASECLARAGVKAGDIALIVLTGGPTEMPAVKSLIRDKFPAAALSEDDKLSSVALGLGHDSRRVFGA